MYVHTSATCRQVRTPRRTTILSKKGKVRTGRRMVGRARDWKGGGKRCRQEAIKKWERRREGRWGRSWRNWYLSQGLSKLLPWSSCIHPCIFQAFSGLLALTFSQREACPPRVLEHVNTQKDIKLTEFVRAACDYAVFLMLLLICPSKIGFFVHSHICKSDGQTVGQMVGQTVVYTFGPTVETFSF